MSWISDVRSEVAALDLSRKGLRKFGILVGTVFLLLGAFGYRKDWALPLIGSFAVAGALLVILGAAAPLALKTVYRIWMALAFAIGGIVSKVLLILIFVMAIIPTAFLGRLLRLPFCEIRTAQNRGSFWIEKKPVKKDQYEKMF